MSKERKREKTFSAMKSPFMMMEGLEKLLPPLLAHHAVLVLFFIHSIPSWHHVQFYDHP
jgi:hypothetical protein